MVQAIQFWIWVLMVDFISVNSLQAMLLQCRAPYILSLLFHGDTDFE